MGKSEMGVPYRPSLQEHRRRSWCTIMTTICTHCSKAETLSAWVAEISDNENSSAHSCISKILLKTYVEKISMPFSALGYLPKRTHILKDLHYQYSGICPSNFGKPCFQSDATTAGRRHIHSQSTQCDGHGLRRARASDVKNLDVDGSGWIST